MSALSRPIEQNGPISSPKSHSLFQAVAGTRAHPGAVGTLSLRYLSWFVNPP